MYKCLIVLGPTATGKTHLAVHAAHRLNAEIISADSRQVYKGLDLGSGKDLSEYEFIENGKKIKIPYHLIDITQLPAEYNVYNYQQDFYRIFEDMQNRSVFPVVCGGTGMYLDSIIRGYDLVNVPTNTELRQKLADFSIQELTAYLLDLKPQLHNTTDITDRKRLLRAIEIETHTQTQKKSVKENPKPAINPLIIGVTYPRDILRKRIGKRLRERFKAGMIQEVEFLHNSGISFERLERLGLEYGFIAKYLQGKIKDADELFHTLHIAIGQFAKRQETWFRGMERKGVKINWIPSEFLSNNQNNNDDNEQKRFELIFDWLNQKILEKK